MLYYIQVDQIIEGGKYMEIKLDIFETMALATIVFYFGAYLRKRIKVLEKYCIPSAVVGGMIFSILMLIFKLNGILTITLDTTLQQVFMTAFFTSVGYTASLRALKQGGGKVIVFLAISTVLVIAQNLLGVSLAQHLNFNHY